MSQSPIQITCDGCGKDITCTSNSVDYRLVLASQPLPSCGGCVTDMMIYDPLPETRHFCGMGCMRVWVAESGAPG